MKTYRNLKETYHHKSTPRAIKNLVAEEGSRKMPKNIMKTLSEDSDAMNRLKQANPLMREQFDKYVAKQKAVNNLTRLKNIGISLLKGSPLISSVLTAPLVYDYYKHGREQH